MIKFEKISFQEYYNYYKKVQAEAQEKYGIWYDVDPETLHEEWEAIKLPQRSTEGSAGYDFFAPYKMVFDRYDSRFQTFPTGIRFVTDRDDIFLMCVPRSGLGFKAQMRLANTCGIIDSDYCHSDNEGHIIAKFTTNEDCVVEQGKAFMQGIIVPFFKTDDDKSTEKRNGGFGSTDRR